MVVYKKIEKYHRGNIIHKGTWRVRMEIQKIDLRITNSELDKFRLNLLRSFKMSKS